MALSVQNKLAASGLLSILLVGACGGRVGANANNNSVVQSPEPAVEPSPAPERSATDDRSSILFIVDSSGSMKANAGGKTRMDAAKEVVNQLIGELPDGIEAGLIAYGHRHTKSCDDIELLVPIGPVKTDAFREKVNALKPLGETPISNSIRHAAALLNDIKGNKSIILISDGEESCSEDPCAVAAELKKANVDLKVHVVGFGINKQAAIKQLSCIAEATGGSYKSAGNAIELKEALGGMAKAADEPPGDTGTLVIDSLDSNSKRIFWCVEVFSVGTTSISNRVFQKCSERSATENAFDVPPGKYDIHFYGTQVLSMPNFRTVEIRKGQPTPISIDQTGRLLLNITDQSGTPLKYVARANSTNDTVKRGGTFYSGEPREILPGVYEIELWGGPVNVPKRTGVSIRPSEETRIDIKVDR